MPVLFSYGTLQRQDVQVSTFGRVLKGWPDELVGFEQSPFTIDDPRFVAESGEAHYTIVRFNGRSDSRVRGTALEVSENELVKADDYEPAGYKRIPATLVSGQQAWVYAEDPSPREAYRRDLAYIHDAGYGGMAEDAARRLIRELARAGLRDGLVVDLGCGSGILAQRMVEAGYRALGVDISDAMVALARRAVPEAEFRAGSFVSTSLPACAAIAAVGEVLNYRFDSANDDDARADFFRRAHHALVPGGLLMFDVATLDRSQPDRAFAEGPDWAILVEAAVERARQNLTRRIVSFRRVDSFYRRDEETHRLTLLDAGAVLQALRSAGFDAEAAEVYDTLVLPAGLVPIVARKPY